MGTTPGAQKATDQAPGFEENLERLRAGEKINVVFMSDQDTLRYGPEWVSYEVGRAVMIYVEALELDRSDFDIHHHFEINRHGKQFDLSLNRSGLNRLKVRGVVKNVVDRAAREAMRKVPDMLPSFAKGGFVRSSEAGSDTRLAAALVSLPGIIPINRRGVPCPTGDGRVDLTISAPRKPISTWRGRAPVVMGRRLPHCDTCDDTGEVMGMACYGGPPVERLQHCPDCTDRGGEGIEE